MSAITYALPPIFAGPGFVGSDFVGPGWALAASAPGHTLSPASTPIPARAERAPYAAPRLQLAQALTEREAFGEAKDLGTVDGWRAFLKRYPRGFRADIARGYLRKLAAEARAPAARRKPDAAARRRTPASPPAAQALAQPPSTSRRPRTPTNRPRVPASPAQLSSPPVITVGRSANALAFDGRYLWVSETARNAIARIDTRRNRVTRRYRVGRDPDRLTIAPNGRLIAATQGDRALWRVRSGRRRARRLLRLKDCPRGLTTMGSAIWVLSAACDGSGATTLRSVTARGKAQVFAALEPNAIAMAAGRDSLYVAHRGAANSLNSVSGSRSRDATGRVSVLVPQTRQVTTVTLRRQPIFAIAANANAGFVAGGRAGAGRVFRIETNETGALIAAQFRSARQMRAVVLADGAVLAADAGGVIHVLDPASLARRGRLRLPADVGPPRAMVAAGTTLYVLVDRLPGTGGRSGVVVLARWKATQRAGWSPAQPRQPVRAAQRPSTSTRALTLGDVPALNRQRRKPPPARQANAAVPKPRPATSPRKPSPAVPITDLAPNLRCPALAKRRGKRRPGPTLCTLTLTNAAAQARSGTLALDLVAYTLRGPGAGLLPVRARAANGGGGAWRCDSQTAGAGAPTSKANGGKTRCRATLSRLQPGATLALDMTIDVSAIADVSRWRFKACAISPQTRPRAVCDTFTGPQAPLRQAGRRGG
ncbi:MAG: hypothetical protein AAFR04_01195 [Pseudomonadota bacterium]